MNKNLLLNISPIILFLFFSVSVYYFFSLPFDGEEFSNFIKIHPKKPTSTQPKNNNQTPTNINANNSSNLYIERNSNKTVEIAFYSMLFLGFGTLSTIILAWLNQRKNSYESRLRIEKLELEIAELKKNIN